jgi:hypothetical protein
MVSGTLETLNNPDLSGMEKFVQMTSTLLMMLPMLS